MTVLIFTLTSCSEINEYETLNGTIWTHKSTEYNREGTLKFQKKTYSLYYNWIENGEEKFDGETGTYKYTNPYVTLITKGKTNSGTISDNKMILKNGDEKFIFTKK
ncbi:MAG: hypothetical protein IMY73_02505 [Bacteroidetes bacterium]|nr:hypothetical protein [Bacteroidota bacterium]